MTQSAWTRDGRPMDAGAIPGPHWEALKQSAKLGDFVMPCCRAPAVLKTSFNGLPFFSHLSDECATAPETIWHLDGKAAILAALVSMGINARLEEPGSTPAGDRWEADILFAVPGRTIAIELQRSYQHLRDFERRQQRYAASSVECYWLVRHETFRTLAKATARKLLREEYGNNFPPNGIGTGMLPSFSVSMLNTDSPLPIQFGLGKGAALVEWIGGILQGSYQYHGGCWNLG